MSKRLARKNVEDQPLKVAKLEPDAKALPHVDSAPLGAEGLPKEDNLVRLCLFYDGGVPSRVERPPPF
jgi:hypothetical protein